MCLLCKLGAFKNFLFFTCNLYTFYTLKFHKPFKAKEATEFSSDALFENFEKKLQS